jgi:hypothetical protein
MISLFQTPIIFYLLIRRIKVLFLSCILAPFTLSETPHNTLQLPNNHLIKISIISSDIFIRGNSLVLLKMTTPNFICGTIEAKLLTPGHPPACSTTFKSLNFFYFPPETIA